MLASNLRSCPYHGHLQSNLPVLSQREDTLFTLDSPVESLPENLKVYKNQISILKDWVLDFLSRPNIELGRKGAVCPWTKKSYDLQHFWVSVHTSWRISIDSLKEIIYQCKSKFLELNSTNTEENLFKTIVILFPHIPEEDYEAIEAVQDQLKPAFVRDKLMIGQFYPGCPQQGLRNPDFKPLNSPLPLLAIRNMVESDEPFLVGNPEFRKIYENLFGQHNGIV